MKKFNDLILREFLQDLADMTNQPELWRANYPHTHIFLENAAASRRPTAIVIAVELQPAQLIMSTLDEDGVADRYLAVGDKTWPDGMDSALKRQVAARFEALLALLNPDWSRPVQPLGEHSRSPEMRRSRSRATRAQRLIPQLAKPAVTG